jgi:predicted HTH transcriptional regulator
VKIARLMQERGLEPPTVAVRDGAVVVTFTIPAPLKTPEKTPEKTQLAILALLCETPHMTTAELASRLDRSESAINRAIRKLRESGRLQRIGPDKGGSWKVLN